MSGVLRLANTGGGTGRSTLEASASNDQTFTLPSAGGTLLTSNYSNPGGTITLDGATINITNGDLNVASGTLFVDESTGNVGINTTNPTDQFQIYNDGTANTVFSITNNGNGVGTVRWRFTQEYSDYSLGLRHNRASNPSTFTLGCGTNGATSVTVDNTNTTLAGNLTVQGSAGVTIPDGGLDSHVQTTNPAATLGHFKSDIGGVGSTQFIVKADGQTGIGVTDPLNPLHILNNYPIIRFQSQLGSYAGRSTVGMFQSGFNVDVDNDNTINDSFLQVNIDGSEKLTIQDDGAVNLSGNYLELGYVPGLTNSTDTAGAYGFNFQHAYTASSYLYYKAGWNYVKSPSRSASFCVFQRTEQSKGTDPTGLSWTPAVQLNANGGGAIFNGTILVGKQATNFAVAGVEVRSSGEITLTRSGDLITTRRISTEGVHMSIRAIDGTIIGSISTNGTNTSFNESSDYRLKENIVSLDNSIERLKELSPKQFNFISHPETTFDGFLAHEVHPVVPEAVLGEKDAVDDNGEIVIQQLDKSKLVPLLTAALQEAVTRIEALESEVSKLRSN